MGLLLINCSICFLSIYFPRSYSKSLYRKIGRVGDFFFVHSFNLDSRRLCWGIFWHDISSTNSNERLELLDNFLLSIKIWSGNENEWNTSHESLNKNPSMTRGIFSLSARIWIDHDKTIRKMHQRENFRQYFRDNLIKPGDVDGCDSRLQP